MHSEPLLLQAVEQPHGYRKYIDHYGESENRLELERPRRWVASVTPMDGRTEISVKEIDLQRIVDQADIKRSRRARARSRDEMAEGSQERSAYRARKAVRLLVQRLQCNRMATFGTRAKLPIQTLLVRFRRFVEYLQRATGKRLRYVAVPELHQSGDHWHLHVALPDFLDIHKANSIWWALCSGDDDQHERNGSINVKRFLCRYHTDDPVGTVAGYISKYLTKSAAAGDINKKKYWATRLPKIEVDRRILEASNIDEAFEEIKNGYGIDAVDVIMNHHGCLFVLPEDRGFWLRILPTMKCKPPF
jgi:hypothetical protein